jgi:hypothetical protein
MFIILTAIFSAVAGIAAGIALVAPSASGIPLGADQTVSAILGIWMSEWWAKLKNFRLWRRRARTSRSSVNVVSAAQSEDEEEVPAEVKQLADDISKLLKISVAASGVVVALIVVRIIGILLKRKVVEKETVDRGLQRLFRIFEWTADFGFVALFFWGTGKEEFAALQRILSILRRVCFNTGTFNIDIPDSMLHGVGLGSRAGVWNRLKRNKWRVLAILIAIIALSVVTARAWKKVAKKGGFSALVRDFFSSGEVVADPPTEAKHKVKRKGNYMASGDGDNNRGRRVRDDGPHAYDPENGRKAKNDHHSVNLPEQVHALPPFRPDSSGEIPMFHKDGSPRAMAGAVSHDGYQLVVSIAHAVRDGGAYWDTAGKQPVKVVRYFNEDKEDGIAVVSAPGNLPKAARTASMSVAHASALIWKQGEVSAGNIFQMDEGKLRHTCGTHPGHSGSLIFAYIEGKWSAVGVHASATSTHNVAYSFF